MAAASGGVCLVVAVFSGPALVFLAVLALGTYFYIRERRLSPVSLPLCPSHRGWGRRWRVHGDGDSH